MICTRPTTIPTRRTIQSLAKRIIFLYILHFDIFRVLLRFDTMHENRLVKLVPFVSNSVVKFLTRCVFFIMSISVMFIYTSVEITRIADIH
ncbi:hypothetical protein NY2A_b287L [Paramecium bursaria Chlorella virus NY2A]|uniref:Uncharacterized protein b287L n=1 Tax=Paramecium bursaria Chlorella virus NY2A TaxID=46021 RepID=A7IWG2_PBCVN|nr:hypothetical protein NY2A_b287L [Paramecium bursaria Chlorella virus NY2A]ABT14686.1 hypothetical protein NY2A_b287L [Paramecium bursaria Chlorella virus NY2A]